MLISLSSIIIWECSYNWMRRYYFFLIICCFFYSRTMISVLDFVINRYWCGPIPPDSITVKFSTWILVWINLSFPTSINFSTNSPCIRRVIFFFNNMLISLKINQDKIINDISLQLKKGQITTLIGPNGGGKTSIARILIGVIKANQGEVLIKKNYNQQNCSLSFGQFVK